MPIGGMVFGGFVGMLLGIVFREQITGRDYGAGQWQRPRDKQFVSDLEGFVRWLALPALTGVVGAVLSPVLYAAFLGAVASASLLALLVAGAMIIVGLYLLFKTHALS